MPPPKTYNYTTNDVVMVTDNNKVFLDFRDSLGKFVPSFRENNVCYQSYAMKKFQSAKQRSTPGNRDFRGSELHFSDFQDFAEWATKENFYGLPHYELDKDLFHDGGIVRYSPETCCLIPASLNAMISIKKLGVSGIQGVHFRADRNNYECSVRYTIFGNPEQRKFIGRFDTAEECHDVYIREKTKLIRNEIAESFKDHVDVRVYERLKQWVPKMYRN